MSDRSTTTNMRRLIGAMAAVVALVASACGSDAAPTATPVNTDTAAVEIVGDTLPAFDMPDPALLRPRQLPTVGVDPERGVARDRNRRLTR